MLVEEGSYYLINKKAGDPLHKDHSIKSDIGRKVKVLLCYNKLNIVQVLDTKDKSRFNIRKECLDPIL